MGWMREASSLRQGMKDERGKQMDTGKGRMRETSRLRREGKDERGKQIEAGKGG